MISKQNEQKIVDQGNKILVIINKPFHIINCSQMISSVQLAFNIARLFPLLITNTICQHRKCEAKLQMTLNMRILFRIYHPLKLCINVLIINIVDSSIKMIMRIVTLMVLVSLIKNFCTIYIFTYCVRIFIYLFIFIMSNQ